MKPWLEDLSEEWIPQPPPLDNKQSSSSPSANQGMQSVQTKPQSRLPRMRHSSGSFSEIQIRHIAKDLHPPKSRAPLAERSLNDNNAAATTSSIDPNITRHRSASVSFSASSRGSVVYNGTVAQKLAPASPKKDQIIQNTPEWRRRLLKGDVGYGEQKDLFSPMGLENIFQKPNGAASEEPKQPKSKLGLFKGLSAMPSSPPPWPSASQPKATFEIEHGPRHTNRGAQRDVEAEDETQPALEFSSIDARDVGNNGGAPRTVSGQIEFDNENFSPVYLSTNLKVTPGPKSIPNFNGSTLAQRLRNLGSPTPTFAHQPASEDDSVGQNRTGNDSSLGKLQDDTLPEDLPAGTPDIGQVMNPFVEMRRGGYSQDGSFRRRPLSPSPQRKAVDRDETRDLDSLDRSGVAQTESSETGTVNVHPQAQSPHQSPVTPRRPRQSQFLSPEQAQTSGSPLKLFDAHDTFTSNRLQRRLSQLEYKSEKTISSGNQVEQTKIVQKAARMTSVEEVSSQEVVHQPSRPSAASGVLVQQRRLGTFGQGQLDKYKFPEELSVLSPPSSEGQETVSDGSPSLNVAPPGSRQPARFRSDGSPTPTKSSRGQRQGLTRVSNPFRRVTPPKSRSVQEAPDTRLHVDAVAKQEYAEGKRGPTSPFKNPTPKRRRTLHSVDSEDDDVFSDSGMRPMKDSHAAIQSVIGRKRKDARHDQSKIVADPEVIARRHILRPRNPTPNQRMRDGIQAEIMEATEAFILSSPKLTTIQEQLNSPMGGGASSEEAKAALVANEVAAFTMKRAQTMKDESRKRSVTTQDFLDEAVKIMDYIRAKGRPTSGLGSLEESEFESPPWADDNPLPSTPLSFSRPPSREGRLSAWREPNKHELDPNVMSHLKKYQERESDEFMGSSVRSLRFSRIQRPASVEDNSVIVEQDNIRIIDNLDRHNKDPIDEDKCVDSQPRTNGTHPSAGSSMGQTIATNASRRSEHVATLAPEAIAHLIPEQIAGMSFDREKNMWVRSKSPSKEHRPNEEASSNESDEDPLGNIPDLTVDETAEYMLKTRTSPTRAQPTAETFLEGTETEEVESPGRARPVTREGKTILPTDTSSVPSKISNNFAWSFPQTDTRATSWSNQEPRTLGTQKLQQFSTTYPIPESDELDVEHEIKYFEGRGNSPVSANPKIRDITFSIEQRDFGAHVERGLDASSPPGNLWSYSNAQPTSLPQKRPWRPIRSAKTLPSSQRPAKLEDRHTPANEDLPPRNYRMQLSMSVSAPVLGLQKQDALDVPISPAKGDVTFMLSDLPEFTLHQVDECDIPDRVVVKHDGVRFSKELEDRYALGTAELIKALQDVVPDEPYWEDLRKVDLQDKGLANLHRLDEFCYRLEELDISGNNISQVKGIPYTMRRLRAENNLLTGLTSWASLMNLQHLDISGNDIDSLDGLSDLIHLRTLKVDNNHLKSLDGILFLDGLMELSASGNQIETQDFAKADMKSLTDLNLSGNRLREVRNVHCLPQLQHLDLDDNCIDEFPITDVLTATSNALRSLRLCRNGMLSLDLSHCPRLESLHVDGNSLTHIPGLDRLRQLRTLSAREQTPASDSDTDICVGDFFRNADVRNLRISVNPTRSLEISQHLLNLQRLELASMGLDELPDNFGQLTPNIRVINLNFNSIKDLRPLLNIKRLNELLVAGNKLARLRTNLAVLGKLTTLTKLDLRENPLTLRFYPPTSEQRVMSLRHKPSEESNADRFVLPAGDVEADRQYLQRLDFETRLRRRVQEIMLSTQCRNLRELDGLPFDKARVLVKDDVWDRLSYLGIIRKTQTAEANHE